MYTIKKFIQYYVPYKGVFFLDLVLRGGYKSCGSGISADSSYDDEDIIYRKHRRKYCMRYYRSELLLLIVYLVQMGL